MLIYQSTLLSSLQSTTSCWKKGCNWMSFSLFYLQFFFSKTGTCSYKRGAALKLVTILVVNVTIAKQANKQTPTLKTNKLSHLQYVLAWGYCTSCQSKFLQACLLGRECILHCVVTWVTSAQDNLQIILCYILNLHFKL